MSESPSDIDMSFRVWAHSCEYPWPGRLRCRDVHLAGPVSLLAARMFVSGFDGWSYPRERMEIRDGSGTAVWTNGVTPRCTP